MKKVRVILFLFVITLFAASIPGTPLSPVYNKSAVRADPLSLGDEQTGTGRGRPRDPDCPDGVWVWVFGWWCFTP